MPLPECSDDRQYGAEDGPITLDRAISTLIWHLHPNPVRCHGSCGNARTVGRLTWYPRLEVSMVTGMPEIELRTASNRTRSHCGLWRSRRWHPWWQHECRQRGSQPDILRNDTRLAWCRECLASEHCPRPIRRPAVGNLLLAGLHRRHRDHHGRVLFIRIRVQAPARHPGRGLHLLGTGWPGRDRAGESQP